MFEGNTSNNPIYQRLMTQALKEVYRYLANDLFFTGKNWEAQPVQLGEGTYAVHLWPQSDESPDAMTFSPDVARAIGEALIACADYCDDVVEGRNQ